MIDSRELRIGNYVFADVGLPYLDTHTVKAHDFVGIQNGVHYIEPIPLTEEWLLKFGFTHDIEQNKSYYSKGKLTINIPDHYHKTGRTYFNSWAIIEYSPKTVHHLMNLYFALTQEELCLKP